jgi:ribonuclease H2 subunit C
MEQAAPPAAGVDLSPAATDLGRVHLLPCGIRHNSAAAVSDYFKPRDTGPCARPTPLSVCLVWLVNWCVRAGVEVDGIRVEEAFFRGRKLQGATVALPDGYRGELRRHVMVS